MAGPEEPICRHLVVVMLATALSTGCAPPIRKPPESPPSLPPQTLSQLQRSEAPPSSQPVAAPAPDPTVVVLEAGGEEGATSDLVAAARAERERRKAAGPPVVVLDDKNIQHFAKDQKLTFANPEKVGGQTDGGPTGSPREDPETYWRQRGRRLRERWKTAVEEIGELKERAAELRTRFYNTDDPYIRDTDVKPAWDRALDRIESMEREVSSIKDSLVQFQEEGQRAGALPAWLLDGFELEPPSAQVEEKSAAPGEPVVLEEKPH